MSAAALDSESSQSSSGYEDGLGRRVLAFDRETGTMLERLVLRPELVAFESALRSRIAIVAALEDDRFARPRDLERDATNHLAVVSDYVAGRRLCDVIDAAADQGIVAGIDAGLGLLLELLPAIARLHDAGLTHGSLAAGRVMITPERQVMLLDAIYAEPLERLRLTRRRLWTELRLAFPPTAGVPRFDKAADLAHAAVIAGSLVLGRPLHDDDYPDGIVALRQEIVEIASIRASKSFADAIDRFFAGALPLAGKRTIATADEAAIDLRKLIRKELGISTCRAALLEFLQQVDTADAEGVGAEVIDREPRASQESERLAASLAEAARRDAERTETERLARERAEAEARERARVEAERLERERQEQERLEAERAEAERRERARLEQERIEQERIEQEARERAEKARLEAERIERERLEAEKRERERLEAQRLEAERLERERREKERRERERIERERLEKERLEAERLEKEAKVRAEKARLEAERLEKEARARAEKARLEAERLERERLERERLEKEARERAEKARLEAERLEQRARERAEKARVEAERLERERLDAERRERERVEKETRDRQRRDAERAERERLEQEARERAERARLEAKRIEHERLEAEKRERERIEAQRLENERLDKAARARAEAAKVAAEPRPAAAAAPAAPKSSPWLVHPDRAAAFDPPVPYDQPPPAPAGRPYPVYVPGAPAVWTPEEPRAAEEPIAIGPVASATAIQGAPFPTSVPPASPPIRLKESGSIAESAPAPRAESRHEPVTMSAEGAYEPFRVIEDTRPIPWKLIAAGVVLIAITLAIAEGYTPAPAPVIQAARKVVPAATPAPSRAAAAPAAAGQIAVTTEPAGLKILLDGKAAGESPVTLNNVSPGRHVVTLIGNGGSLKRIVRVEPGRGLAIDVPVFSGFAVVSAPFVLQIAENGKSLGTSEDQVILGPGHHELNLSNVDLAYSGTESVDVTPGEVTRVSIDPRGRANINAAPWAEVWIDGEKAGETPLANVPIRLGVREIVFKNPQFPDRKVVTTVKAGVSATVAVDFSKDRPPIQ